MDATNFHVVYELPMEFIAETIVAAVALGVIVSLINMASARD